MMLTDLADVLRAAGLTVVELPGWKTRGRPGSFNPIGVLCHHTGGTADSRSYVNWMALTGRASETPPLPPPLVQLALSRTGIVYVLAAGRANHAGRCKPIAGLKPYPGRDYGDGNAQLIGIEAMNTGSEGWTETQRSTYVAVCAALNLHYGWPASRTLGHKETSLSGKPDPGKLDMPNFRADVQSAMGDRYPGQALARGSSGPAVAAVQKRLGLTSDGSYGPGTEAAVRVFQTTAGLQVDGKVGPATWAALFQEDDMYDTQDRERDKYISAQVKAVAQMLLDLTPVIVERTATAVLEGLKTGGTITVAPIDPAMIEASVKKALREGTGA